MNHSSNLAHNRIALVDDHGLILEGLHSVLQSKGMTDVAKFTTASGLIERLDAGDRFDCYIIGLELTDVDGFVLIEMIRARMADATIIVSTSHEEVWTLRKLLDRGVNGIIYKSGVSNEIISALDEVSKGRRYYCKRVLQAMEEAKSRTIHPTARELDVLIQISKGKTSREIAAAMFVTENTVEAHRKSLMAKLGAVNVADLVMKSIEKGYLKK